MTGKRIALIAAGACTMVAVVTGWLPSDPDAVYSQAPSTSMRLELLTHIGGLASAVAIDGTDAYLLVSGRLLTLDVTNPSRMTLAAETERFAQTGRQLVPGRGYLYLVDPRLGIHVIDPSGAEPQVVGLTSVPDARALRLAGQYAYVAAGEHGLKLLDMSEPSDPQVAVEVGTTRVTRDVLLVDDYAYLAERGAFESGVRVLDVSDPLQPEEGVFVHTPGGADFLATDGEFVYVVGAGGSIWVLTTVDPAQPKRWGYQSIYGEPVTPGVPVTGPTLQGVAIAGDYAYLPAGTKGVCVVDIIFGGRPSVAGWIDTPGEARSVAIKGSQPYLYVADWTHGARAYDLEDPNSPVAVASYDSPGDVADVSVAGELLCLAQSSRGLLVADATDPVRPRMAGFLAKSGSSVNGVSAYDGGAGGASYCAVAQQARYHTRREGERYVTDYLGGLQIVDVSDRDQPRQRAVIDHISLAGVAAQGDTLFGASVRSGSRTPIYPSLGLPFATTDGTRWPAELLRQSRAKASADDLPFSGLAIVDVAVLAQPEMLARLELGGTPQDVAVDGTYAHVASYTAGLQTIDVSDPSSPRVTGQLTDTFGNALGVAAAGDRAFLAIAEPYPTRTPMSAPGALSIVDVSDRSDPKEVGRLPLDNSATGVTLSGEYAVVADRYGVTLVDVSDPADPVWLDRFVPSNIDPDLLPRTVSVDSANSLVYVAVNPSSIFVLGLREGPVPTPSVVPTGIPTATPEPTWTPSVTPTPDTTVTETPTAGPEGEEVYLPYAHS